MGKIIYEPDLKIQANNAYLDRAQIIEGLNNYQQDLLLWEYPPDFEEITSINTGQDTQVFGNFQLLNFKLLNLNLHNVI